MNPQEKREFEEMKNFIKNMQNASTIPLTVDQSFRARFSNIGSALIVSSKSATSENETIDEAGASIHSVLKAPDGFLQIQIGSIIYNIPIYI